MKTIYDEYAGIREHQVTVGLTNGIKMVGTILDSDKTGISFTHKDGWTQWLNVAHITSIENGVRPAKYSERLDDYGTQTTRRPY